MLKDNATLKQGLGALRVIENITIMCGWWDFPISR